MVVPGNATPSAQTLVERAVMPMTAETFGPGTIGLMQTS
jgi:hypothetical protein